MKSPNRKDVEVGKMTLSLDSGGYTRVHLCSGILKSVTEAAPCGCADAGYPW